MMKNILICLVFTTLVFTSFTPDQLIKTNMTIVVVNEQGAVVEGATVRLFKTINDYNNHKNQVQETKESNEKGVVKFTNIDAISYYLQIEKGDLSNMFTEEKTEPLAPKKVNKFIIVIE